MIKNFISCFLIILTLISGLVLGYWCHFEWELGSLFSFESIIFILLNLVGIGALYYGMTLIGLKKIKSVSKALMGILLMYVVGFILYKLFR